MLKFLRIPFGQSGDRATVPDAPDVSGSVSYTSGYGVDYARAKTDPLSKNIEREKMNQVFFDATAAIGELQSQGVPDFITTALNGGTPFGYAKNSVVKYSDGNLYISLVAANTALPTDASKWVRYDALLAFDGVGAVDICDQNKPMADYTALRAYTGRALGVRVTSTGVAGFFARSLTDTTTADNGGTVIVDAAGRRWFRVWAGNANVMWFGAKGQNSDDTAAFQAALDNILNGTIEVPVGIYAILNTLEIRYDNSRASCNLIGAGYGATLLWKGAANSRMIRVQGTTVNAGTFARTRIEGLYFKNDVPTAGMIGIQLGSIGSALGATAGVQNVNIQFNRFDYFDIGVHTEYESDGIVVQDNVFFEYNLYGIHNAGSACFRALHNYCQMGQPGSIGIYSEYSNSHICNNLIQSTNAGVVGGVQVKNVAGFQIENNYIEHAFGGTQFAIYALNSSAGYIGSNSIQGFQGSDLIVIDGTSKNINIGPQTHGFFAAPVLSLIKLLPGATNVNVLANQETTGAVTTFLGTGYGFVYRDGNLMVGIPQYATIPNAGIAMSGSGVLNIGNAAASSGWGFMTFGRAGVNIGSVTQTGTTGVAYNTSSDYRLKEIDGPISNARDFIMALKPCEGRWRADGSPFAGFLAHEFQAVSPSSVVGEKDAVDENGSPIYQAMQASSPEAIANIVALLQEHVTILAELKTKLGN